MNKKVKYEPLNALEYPRFEGIRTFRRLPHVTDLTDVQFAYVGIPFDTACTFRVGARFGPSDIREHSLLLRPYNPVQNINIFENINAVDFSDIPIIPTSIEKSFIQIEDHANKIFDRGVVPTFVGGDNSISLPCLRAAYKKYGKLSLIHFDSHCDLWDGYWGEKYTHGTPFRRALEEGLIDSDRSIQIGLRGPLYEEKDAYLGAREGFEIITGPQLHEIGMPKAVEIIQEKVGGGPAYIGFDIDFVDPAYAPGTGTPEVGGFTSAQTLQLVRGLKGLDIVAFDLVEVSPPYDPAHITSLLAANLIYEFMTLVALAKRNS